ncbi:tRNA (adenosine(37)-N6)-threonylcarbamoyltransferase complex transferase subunit TsaD [Romboutsia sp. 1001216sp1]|uniref:tRNA (adenosine(37)-N6)-threonylcarbamoyltransferase complex transferase subunit TsaD n=1 Tax=unclassified Romboutsia TaxID=2626894 RepID=UPI00189F9A7C|nr:MULTISPECIES: tRNA (adenosine(37)-N6)-threonylcarbamoyltransferase complex transferase subunit TsaD [unclassified Romboutsia]MDB8789780.1 tRNA (adenosine(37)-N6)-threonylcarbamoyltransferase complex transferase subunit TsaD [Romboutsia sp. 1001216sp1]MDB8802914.1 tRNA (adenosine(37)-N6)-threonylcarbamoyltransferase complex transferase subunit TsaD [Romboutsia sp. 1001216sp1]MDB8814196.1 tRNA (adenosine(37)-N6)-threonylcarbamoyltransferase complex transferase subunit TsaD [Romboutsia sp. 10012
MKDIITLSVESSCDETSIAILKNGREVLTNIVSTQIDLHKKFGGVVPEVASRKHIENIDGVLQEALDEAKIELKDIDHIAVTYGPGLVGALLVGLSYAKSLAFCLNKPLVGVNHIEGHVSANYIAHKDLKPPFITLIVSGGHTHLVEVKDYGKYEILGRTRDDASGEAFDKIARAMGLGYPGGPIVDKLAKQGNKNAIDFPRAYLDEGYDFSFSGLKSAVLNYLNAKKMKKEEIVVEDVCASFQEAVVEVLSQKAIKAAKEKGYSTIALAGGVACNSALREKITELGKENNIDIKYPPVDLCTDNAAMIGCAGYYNYINGIIDDMSLNAVPNLKIGQR